MKIIGSDFDGTFNCNGITEAKLLAIEKWRSAGNKFGIVTGRDKNFLGVLLQQFPELKLDFFVSCNGGYITDVDGRVIYEARCTGTDPIDLMRDLFEWGCKFINIIGENYACVVENYEDGPSYVAKEDLLLISKYEPAEYFNQVSVFLPSMDKASEVTEKLRTKYMSTLNPLQNGQCIDIVPIGVNKAQGLYRVMEFFGSDHESVIAVGDNINDADMIREFYSYAMKSGVEEIKALADGIVSDVIEIFSDYSKMI